MAPPATDYQVADDGPNNTLTNFDRTQISKNTVKTENPSLRQRDSETVNNSDYTADRTTAMHQTSDKKVSFVQ